jgi:NADP-dependent 3-hydroxy acid dehydrogenase YdfG
VLSKFFDIPDRVVVVNGVGSGLGSASSGVFAHLGAKVVLADISEKGLAATHNQIQSPGQHSVMRLLDVTDSAVVDAAAN